MNRASPVPTSDHPRPPTRRGRANAPRTYPSADAPAPNLYQLAMRERCKPLQCTKDIKCWVALGGSENIEKRNATPRCNACHGEIREVRWLSPKEWAEANGLTPPKIID